MNNSAMTMTDRWNDVEESAQSAILIAWDTCHKIYLAMDKTEADYFRAEYPEFYEGTPEQMVAKLHEWFDASCPLKFISAVDAGDFTSLIEQFAEDEDTCSNCGYADCYGGECYEDEDEDEEN